jgi:hypothetical protein
MINGATPAGSNMLSGRTVGFTHGYSCFVPSGLSGSMRYQPKHSEQAKTGKHEQIRQPIESAVSFVQFSRPHGTETSLPIKWQSRQEKKDYSHAGKSQARKVSFERIPVFQIALQGQKNSSQDVDRRNDDRQAQKRGSLRWNVPI